MRTAVLGPAPAAGSAGALAAGWGSAALQAEQPAAERALGSAPEQEARPGSQVKGAPAQRLALTRLVHLQAPAEGRSEPDTPELHERTERKTCITLARN